MLGLLIHLRRAIAYALNRTGLLDGVHDFDRCWRELFCDCICRFVLQRSVGSCLREYELVVNFIVRDQRTSSAAVDVLASTFADVLAVSAARPRWRLVGRGWASSVGEDGWTSERLRLRPVRVPFAAALDFAIVSCARDGAGWRR